MPTQLPTKTVCLNCDYEVKIENKYCPSCGQENADKRISLKLLVQDAVATAFNFESRVFKTIPLFLFYPGKLTNEFLEGKRVRYMHPFKIYLLSSVLFFFVVIKLFTPAIENGIRKLDKTSEKISIGLSLEDSIQKSNNSVPENEFNEDYKSALMKDSISKSNENTAKFKQKELALRDSISTMIENIKAGKIDEEGSLAHLDSSENLLEDSVFLAQFVNNSTKNATKQANGLRKVYSWIQDRNMTPSVLLDSLDGQGEAKDKTPMRINTAAQLLKIGRNDPAIFLANIINNIGTFMFFTLPLLAFFFVPFYIRRQKYYIDHLIFTLHLQAFTFVVLTLAAVFFHWDFYFISVILSILLMFYVWVAFKKVYKQGFFKTTIKAYIISFLYLMTLLFMLYINLVYSFYTF